MHPIWFVRRKLCVYALRYALNQLVRHGIVIDRVGPGLTIADYELNIRDVGEYVTV